MASATKTPSEESTETEQIVVDQPIRKVYNQWTQFEDFPKFMEGVEVVRQQDDKTVFFRVNVGGKDVEYTAEVTEQVPDKRIVWRSIDGKETGGMVTFTPEGSGRTRVELRMYYAPEGVLENVGDLLGLVGRRMKLDLQNFKKFIESRDQETGAWRGQI